MIFWRVVLELFGVIVVLLAGAIVYSIAHYVLYGVEGTDPAAQLGGFGLLVLYGLLRLMKRLSRQ